MQELKYLAHYPPQIIQQIQTLLEEKRLGMYILEKYPVVHDITSARALYDFTMAIKSESLRSSKPISKVVYDDKIHIINHALGLHTYISRVQGKRLKAKNEIRVSSLFRRVPIEFLKMIVVHELAHLREREHDKAFYKLCEYMEPSYHQLEFDLRVYLTHLDCVGEIYNNTTKKNQAAKTRNEKP